LPDVAATLNNFAYLYCSTERIEKAEVQIAEAECILDPFWQQNLELHSDLMARIIWTEALVSEARENPAAETCALARRALAAAYDPSLKHSMQELVDRLCPESVG
jgi:hypothetical protein